MKLKSTRPITMVVAMAIGIGTCGLLRASEMDERIESSATKSYVYRTYLKEDHIKIESKDGVVTLTGTVSEDSHKTLAEDTVRGLPGVKSVDNRLVVQPATTAKSDDWLGTKVKAALLFHRNVSAKTQVSVQDGIVTLRGTAATQAQKDLTTEYARDVEGVKKVVNEMTVVNEPAGEQTMGEKIDDASITAQVKAALLTHRSTSAVKTKVKTSDGEVTISGTARNAAEKDLVTKLVQDIKGVKKVNNLMTVSE